MHLNHIPASKKNSCLCVCLCVYMCGYGCVCMGVHCLSVFSCPLEPAPLRSGPFKETSHIKKARGGWNAIDRARFGCCQPSIKTPGSPVKLRFFDLTAKQTPAVCLLHGNDLKQTTGMACEDTHMLFKTHWTHWVPFLIYNYCQLSCMLNQTVSCKPILS